MGTSSAVEKVTAEAESDVTVAAARQAVTQRLMDSLLHDVRNPLNALSINLDVLTEKLRREQGEIPATQEKNLKVMREQVFRVDGILKQFSEFMVYRPDPIGPVDLSETVKQALIILGHECRRAMVKVRQMIEPDLRVSGSAGALRFLVVQSLFRAILRAGNEGEVDITFQRQDGHVLLRIRDSAGEGAEPFAQAEPALERMCADASATLRINGNELQILFPLV